MVDLRPETLEELNEVITYVVYHPSRSDLFAFSSSRGYITLCDTRATTSYQCASLKFQAKEDPARKNFFSDMIGAMTRVKFAPTSDNYIFSRDYLSVQIWDIRSNK